MTNSQRLAIVRDCLLQWLAAQRESGGAPVGSENPIVRESVLIRDEFYCGRRFHTAAHNAVWFIEEDELKIYRSSGELECVLSSEEIRGHETDEANSAPQPVIQQPDAQPTAETGLPAVIKMPTPAETNVEADDDSGNELRRAA